MIMNTLCNDNNGHNAAPQQDRNDNSNSNSNRNSNSNKRKIYQEEQRDDDNEENNNSNNNYSMTQSQSPSTTFYHSAGNIINGENGHREDFHAQEVQAVVDNDEEIRMINSHSSHSPNSSTSFPSSFFESPTKKHKSSLSSLSPSSSSFSLLSPPPVVPRKSLFSSSSSSSSSSSISFHQEREGGEEEDLSFLAFPTLLSHDAQHSPSSTLLLPRLTSSSRRIILVPRNFCCATLFPSWK